ncbi:MAG: SIMPL domain-containing protein [Candidatus Paceibacterota bacterium]
MDTTKSFLGLWYVRGLLILALVGLVAALAAYAHLTIKEARYSNYGPTTINVRGEGEVLARPDIGQFTFSVRAQGDDAASAQEQSAEAMNGIIAYLTEAGVAENDIKTTNYNLNPRYVYEERACPMGSYCPPGEQRIDGYEVSQMVEVKVRELDNSGDLISGVGSRGATNISGLQFTIDDEDDLKAEAREAAIAEAKEKAEELADALGVRIVRMVGYYEEEMYQPYYGMGGDMAMSESAMARVAPNMPTGENEITATVNITYEVR